MPLRGHRRKHNKNKARQQARAASPAKQEALLHYYNSPQLAHDLAKQRFRFTAFMRATQRKMPLNGYLNQVQWQDLSAQAWMQGNITLRAVSAERSHFAIAHGDVIRGEVFWDRAWRYLWDMRIWDPDRVLAAGNPQMTTPLYDDLYLLSISKDDFHYTNLYCHEILIRIATRYKLPLGKIAMGTYKIKTMDQQGVSPLDAIIWAYQQERNHTGRRYVLKWRHGRIHVTPLQRNPLLYVMHNQLVDATAHHVTPDGFATALTGRSSVTDAKTGKVRKHNYTATHSVDAYGFVHQQADYNSNYDEPHLVNATKHDLAKRQIINHSIDFDHQGIALISKGDAVQILIPEEGYVRRRSIVWVTDITHTLQPGQYTMTPTVTASAPLGMPDLVVRNKNKQQRKAKRSQRKRTTKPAPHHYNGSRTRHSAITHSSGPTQATESPLLYGLLHGGSGP